MDAQLQGGYEAFELDPAESDIDQRSQHLTDDSAFGGRNVLQVAEKTSGYGLALSHHTGEPAECLPSEAIASGEREYDDMSLQNLVAESRQSYIRQNPLQCISPPLSILDDSSIIDAKEQIEAEHVAEEDRHEGVFHERWQVDKECASLIASVVSAMESEQAGPSVCAVYQRCQDLRLEEPVLLTHHEADMEAVLDRNRICVSAELEKAFPYHLNIEKDEDIAWSAKALDLPIGANRKISSEKLQIERQTMHFLRQLETELDDGLREHTEVERRRKAVQRASPVVLPLSPTPSPALLPLDVANVGLTSTPEDPSLCEAAILDDLIAERDQPHLEDSNVDELANEQLPSLLCTPHRVNEMQSAVKVSSPILPCIGRISESPLADCLNTIAYVDEYALAASPQPASTDSQVAASVLAELKEVCGPVAATAIMKLDEEELIEADTTMRVTVPEIHIIKSSLPWESASFSEPLIPESVRGLSEADKRCTGISKLEKTLSWRPFPSNYAKLKPEGEFDDGSCARYLAELALDDDVDINRLTWKPEGLRVLDSDEDEEENLELAQLQGEAQGSGISAEALEQDVGITAVQNHWTLALADSAKASRSIGTVPRPTESNTGPGPPHQLEIHRNDLSLNVSQAVLKRKLRLVQEPTAKRAKGLGSFEEAAFATKSYPNATNGTAALLTGANPMEHFGQFLSLQGQAHLPDPTMACHIFSRPSEAISQASKTASAPEITTIQSEQPDPATNYQPFPSIPTPRITMTDTPKSIILSSTLMTSRHLIRRLQDLLPTLDMISRDHLGHRDREADITLSHSTAIMLTSLQRLKQRALPGQEDYFGFREQVHVVSRRYEKLIVLIGETQQGIEVQGLEERDAEAIVVFMGHMASLTCEVQVVLAPGGQQELVRWIAAFICRDSHSDHDFTLLQEETFWERFLRKAGLNAYAAQAVIAQLKPLDAAEGLIPNSPEMMGGLATFVLMSEEERVRRFGLLMGGETVLRGASRIIDARWKSAANVR